MDPAMRELRRHLQWVLGLEAHGYVDKMLPVVTSGDPLLLIGPPDCEQRALAAEVHRTSARRDRGFIAVEEPPASRAEQVAHLAQADRGTLFLDLAGVKALPAFFVQQLFGDQPAAGHAAAQAQLERRRASLLGRINVVLALILMAAGVMLVRGTPW